MKFFGCGLRIGGGRVVVNHHGIAAAAEGIGDMPAEAATSAARDEGDFGRLRHAFALVPKSYRSRQQPIRGVWSLDPLA